MSSLEVNYSSFIYKEKKADETKRNLISESMYNAYKVVIRSTVKSLAITNMSIEQHFRIATCADSSTIC